MGTEGDRDRGPGTGDRRGPAGTGGDRGDGGSVGVDRDSGADFGRCCMGLVIQGFFNYIQGNITILLGKF